MVTARRTFLYLFLLFLFFHPSKQLISKANAQEKLAYSVAGKNRNYVKRNTEHTRSVARVNKGTVGIITGDIGGTYMRIAADLSAVLDSNRPPELRLLPISGRGGKASIEDLLFLRGIDLAIVQSDILDHMEQERKYQNIRKRVKYIVKLFDSELHIITRSDINNISQLQGKKVNFRYKGSSADLTGNAIFNSFNIRVIPTYFDQSLALEKIKTGELDASVVVTGKPNNIYALIPPNSGLRLLPVEFTTQLSKSYLPAAFTHKDYPGLIKKGERVPTIASSTVLAVYNWPENTPRYRKVALLVYNLFTYISEFKKPERHRKWVHTSPITKIPGWSRFQAAQHWIDNSYQFFNSKNASTAIFQLTGTTGNIGDNTESALRRAALYKKFSAYLRQFSSSEQLKNIDEQQLARLFQSFLRWQDQNN